MDAQRIKSFMLWYRDGVCEIDECDIFGAAYEWKYGELQENLRASVLGEDIMNFLGFSKVPQYVEEYLHEVIFPRLTYSSRNIQ